MQKFLETYRDIILDDEEKIHIDPEAVIAELEEGGAIAQKLRSYEKRQSQLDLMRLVIRGFNEDAIVAAEAGTGVGKSFAYLLPSIVFSLLNDERVIVSTATITLQQQLFEKDIPLVESALDQRMLIEKKFKVALLKGKNNYLCLRRLDDAVKEEFFFTDEEYENLKSMSEWAASSKTGSRSDMDFLPDEKVWNRVCSESDNCLGIRCTFKDLCFSMSARRNAEESQIVVVNHHLLFADIAARRGGAGYGDTAVLPAYTRVILDEGHAIEQSATSFFAEKFSRHGIYKHTGRLLRRNRADRHGLLTRLGLDRNALDALEDEIKSIREAVDALDEAGSALCGVEGVFRFTSAQVKSASYVRKLLERLKETLTFFVSNARNHFKKLKEQNEVSDGPVMWEISSICRNFEAIAQICESFMFFEESPDKVFWLESRRDFTQWTVTPLDAAAVLRESLFKPNKTVVCVSATLAVAGRWEYWNSQFGLEKEGERTLTGIFPSPFPYATNVLVTLPTDAPLPNEGDYGAFVDAIVPRLVSAASGSSLALFTSYESLKSAFVVSSPILAKEGIVCLKQGDADRTRLLHEFLSDKKSALFATDSFWEGIDAPGDTLRLVILCRLPFRTPGDPVFQARCEYIERQGRSSFMEMAVPEAVMKFKQGFGRLMRSSTDYGVVAVLDGRLTRKSYGKYFLDSLPQTRRRFANQKILIRETERFLNEFAEAKR
ncbi:MAG: ATP-dependent DNA helicase DinG [Treponema sp.]|nr:ATP-dependent DNA helicase DinG [Treponema sp.]